MPDKAEQLAKKQREISISEFFEKNRHLLGFDNKRKALLTTIKEAVDNSLDACEEARILPEIIVEITELNENKFRVKIEDNGPGIIKAQIPKIFGKLLYGSKFHSMSQSRGQQGIGISAAVLYGQLTTGKPARIISKTGKAKANYYELTIDTANNKPEIGKEQAYDWDKKSGTSIEVDIEATYQKGLQSVDQYIKQTAIINPHLTLIYTNPKAEQFVYSRITDDLPKETVEIKPHPYGVELGKLIKLLKTTESKTLQSFLTTDFSRVGANTAKEICKNATLLPSTKPQKLTLEQAEKLAKGIKETKITAPSTDCISPIGEELFEKGLKKEINAEFYTTTTRPPSVYRGNPFIIEAGIAYGGTIPGDSPVQILRYANRVPLQYQQGACGMTQSIIETNWKSYGLHQPTKSIPQGPIIITVHLASVWVPFTSEAKEAIAHYPEIIKEMKLTLQEVGRKLQTYINKKKKVGAELKKRSYIEKYIPHITEALKDLLEIKDYDEESIKKHLKNLLETKRGEVENLKFDPTKNEEFEEELAIELEKEEKEEDEKE